jgi:hypothetical protein
MARFSHLLKNYAKNSSIARKAMVMFSAKKEVDINGNGTSGYLVKHGKNEGKILGHKSVKSTNNW